MMSRNLPPHRFTIYMDSYYSSYMLFQRLYELRVGAVGTVRLNRLKLDAETKGRLEYMIKGDVLYHAIDNCLLSSYSDKRDVHILSNCLPNLSCIQDKRVFVDGNERTIKIRKPWSLLLYNQHAHGVDLHNQFVYSHRGERRSKK